MLFSLSVKAQQTLNYEDSIINTLAVFEKFLDRNYKDIDENTLIKALNRTAIQKKYDLEIICRNEEQKILKAQKNEITKSFRKQTVLMPYDSIWRRDSMNYFQYFDELNYDLPNREILIKYKNRFQKTKSNKEKVFAMITYLGNLSHTFPYFTSSNSAVRYINDLQFQINALKSDTAKAFALVNFSELLIQLDITLFHRSILTNLLEAEKILFSPYLNELEKIKSVNKNRQVEEKVYKKFILSCKYSEVFFNIYNDIFKILGPINFDDKDNSLLPFRRKANSYARTGYNMSKILFENGKITREKFEYWREKLLEAFDFVRTKPGSFYSNLTREQQFYSLDNLEYFLLEDSANYSCLHRARLFSILSNAFLQNNRPKQAKQALYIGLKFLIEDQRFNPYENEGMLFMFKYLFNLFHIRNSVDRNYFHLNSNIIPLFKAFRLLYDQNEFNQSFCESNVSKLLILCLNNETKEAKEFLSNLKKDYLKILSRDRQTIGNDDDVTLCLAALYFIQDELGWQDKAGDTIISFSGIPVRIDSLLIKGFHSPYSSFLQDRYLLERFSDIEQTELNVWWRQRQRSLYSQIDNLKNLKNKLANDVKNLGDQNDTLILNNSNLIRNINEKNQEIKNLDTSIQNQNKELSNTKAENIKLQNFNEKLERTSLIFFVGIIFLVEFLIRIFFIIKQQLKKVKLLNREIVSLEVIAKEKNLGRKLAEQKLLNDTALGHDLIELIQHVPYFVKSIKKELSPQLNNIVAYQECLQYSENLGKYFKSNFDLKEEALNTVEEDLVIAKEYCMILEMMNRYDGTAEINFDIHPDLLKIKIPKHTIVNFVANSYRHGRSNNEVVHIRVDGLKTIDGFVIKISDDGGGFETINLEHKKNTRGIKLVLRQVENFNAIENNYFVDFTLSDIENIFMGGKRHGTQISYKLISK